MEVNFCWSSGTSKYVISSWNTLYIMLMMIWQKVSRLDSTLCTSIWKKKELGSEKRCFDFNLAKSKSYAGQRKCRWNHSRNFHFRKCNKMKDIDVINNGVETFLKSDWIPRFSSFFLIYFLQALNSKKYVYLSPFSTEDNLFSSRNMAKH